MGRAGGTRQARDRCFLSDLAGLTGLPLPPALPTKATGEPDGSVRLNCSGSAQQEPVDALALFVPRRRAERRGFEPRVGGSHLHPLSKRAP